MRHVNTPKADPSFRLPHPENKGTDPFAVTVRPEEIHHSGPVGKPMAEREIFQNAKRQHGVEPR